ncbi:MAG: helix-turn-helix transcriptional regulator [Clostridiales bacterium]|nr:helix-turn-helix transcriptional regulator [Clostridiales bacterium]
MAITMGEKIKIMLGRRGMTLAQLAEKTGQSRQNMSNKMSRDNFSEKELLTIAKALNCTFDAHFIMNDTHETI